VATVLVPAWAPLTFRRQLWYYQPAKLHGMKLGSAFVSWRAGTLVFLVRCVGRFSPESSPRNRLILPKSAISSCPHGISCELSRLFSQWPPLFSSRLEPANPTHWQWRKTIVPARHLPRLDQNPSYVACFCGLVLVRLMSWCFSSIQWDLPAQIGIKMVANVYSRLSSQLIP
jgi:hypothetical protein